MAPSALLPTYDDSPAIGKDFPSMSTTKHIKNTEYKAEGLRVVALVAKYDKGGCERVPEVRRYTLLFFFLFFFFFFFL
jgi:hypothetical protein